MIVEKHVSVKINSTTLKYWQDKGYAIPTHVDCKGRTKTFRKGNTSITVAVKDLQSNSNAQIHAVCEDCGVTRKLKFLQYAPLCWKCNLQKSNVAGKDHTRYDASFVEIEDRAFERYIWKTYKLEASRYYQMLKNQDFQCAICYRCQTTDARRLAIDHCHKTDKIRGLICQSCNTALGLLQESTSVVSSALSYLQKAENETSS